MTYLFYFGIAVMIICGLAHGIARLIQGSDFYWVPLIISSGGLLLIILEFGSL